MSSLTFQPLQIIVREGEAPDFAFYIKSGTVEVFIKTSQGEKLVAEHHRGDFFGEMGLILEEPRLATVRAKTRVVLETFDLDGFEKRVIGKKAMREAYLPNLFERVRIMSGLLRSTIENPDSVEDYALEKSFHSHPVDSESEFATLRITSVDDGFSADDTPTVDQTVDKFPFNIGRESESKLLAENDLHIKDGFPNTVSRGHCCIDKIDDRYLIRDRFSRLGTIVNGEIIGRKGKSFTCELQEGENELILGQDNSPHRFIITLKQKPE
ncbi:MAG: cyclic nucleotide-binding domain-containing protein [Verrucomicrobiota bacterium]